MSEGVVFLAIVLVFVAFGTTLLAMAKAQHLRRAEFIRTFRFPRGLFAKLQERHPNLTRKDIALVSRGLRQFFLAYLMGRNHYVAMPSKIVDDLWHEFILYTRDYKTFCSRAFGEFLHHTPAAAMDPSRKGSNEGLRRVWWHSCKTENLNAMNPSRLPLLFALDGKLAVEGGYFYYPDCEQLRRNGVPGTQCASDFTRTDIDGSLEGLDGRRKPDSSSCGGGCGSCGGEGGGCGGD